MNKWRICNSEAKSDVSSRAYSTAVRASRVKGLTIPKGNIKKKNSSNMTAVQNFISMKQNFKTI